MKCVYAVYKKLFIRHPNIKLVTIIISWADCNHKKVWNEIYALRAMWPIV